jgi:uncharacterized protein DUF4011/restriction endonuclease-like protein/AAA domain-containing protein/uncharacterized protein DUF3320
MVSRRLEDWRSRLIDLSGRNRLISFKPNAAATLQIAAPDVHELLKDPDHTQPWDFFFPADEGTDEIASQASNAAMAVDELLLASRDHGRSRRSTEIEATETNPKRIARILDNLAKRSKSEFQDKAIRILYLAIGFLDWRDPQRDQPLSSPLILVPAELRRESTRDPYRLFFVDDEEIVVNPSLTEKLRRETGLEVPADWVWEDKSIAQKLDEIRTAVAGKGWSVREDAVLGLFSFRKYVMYRDLLDNEDRVLAHPLVQSLAHGRLSSEIRNGRPPVPEAGKLDDAQPPDRTLSILDSDASQRQCVEAARRGHSFVMQGPPGTGKSQTIANIIAEAIGDGRRVLFVSEKAAALDVVFKRLAASGLDEYCLMLHGEHAGRREVVHALDRSVNSAPESHLVMRHDEMKRLANLRTTLNDSARLLHSPASVLGGRTLRQIQEDLARLHRAPSVPGAPEASAARADEVLAEFHALSEIFQRLVERWRVSARDFVWRGYRSETFTNSERGGAVRVLRVVREALEVLESRARDVAATLELASPGSYAECERLVQLCDHLRRAPSIDASWLDLDPAALADGAARAQRAYGQLAARGTVFRELLPGREVADVAADSPERLRLATAAVRQQCGWASAWDEALTALPATIKALDDLPGLIGRVRTSATETAATMGQSAMELTQARIVELAELAELSFTAEHRPEPAWLVRAGLDRAEAAIDALACDLDTYQRDRAAVLDEYLPEVLELDAAGMASRFETQYTSVFSKLGAGYRRDADVLKRVRETGKLPAVPADDLKRIAALQTIGKRIDEVASRTAQALGVYAAGRDTSTASVRDAIATGRRVLELSDAHADLEQLAKAVAVGSSPTASVAQAADQLRDADRRLRERLLDLDRFVATAGDLHDGNLDDLSAFVSRLDGPLRALAHQVADLEKGASQPAMKFVDIEHRALAAAELHEVLVELAEAEVGWREIIGPSFAAAETDWDLIQTAATWLGDLRGFVGDDVTPSVRQAILASPSRPVHVADIRSEWEAAGRAGAQLRDLFEPQREAELQQLLQDGTFDDVRRLCDDLSDHVDELLDWTQWRGWRRRAAAKNWDGFLDALVDAAVNADGVVAAFQRAFWSRRVEAHDAQDPELVQDLRGGAFQRWVDEFCELDRKLVGTGADRLIAERERTRRSLVSTPDSELGLLRAEARKARRHRPVRELLSRIPTLLSELKPCLMMSPLTVSHFLAPDHTFDLVIFDEASQVAPQDAINCIYRGSQLIVAGDSKQLPPTAFFETAEVDELRPDEEDEHTREDMESILDSCEAALFPQHQLSWHYRSRSESLIAFSNQHIYDQSLVTFPSVESQSHRMGVDFVYVPDGVWDRGKSTTNRREAKVVAGRVVHHLLDGSDRSVGVIAFNSAQAGAIEEELDLLRARQPELEGHFRGDRLDAVFVKHLESVQGDERDVIVFSVGFARDVEGKFTMNFGPLNKDGGERRLNVAVTRARERVELVSSVRAHDFSLGDGAKPGARLLRDYIAYAEASGCPTDAEVDAGDGRWSTPLEAEIAEAIRELGFHAVPSVGVGSFRIDIGVTTPDHPDRFVLGIECDGAGYARTPTARDRERLRHEVLAGLGWGQIHRIWSLDWVRNRSGEIDRLSTALEAAIARNGPVPDDVGAIAARVPGPAAQPEPRARVDREVIELHSSGAAHHLPWTCTYERARIEGATSAEFHDPANLRQQTDMLVELLRVEAPVSVEYAVRRLAEAWGLERTGSRIRSAGLEAVGRAEQRGAADRRGDFLWRPGQTLTCARVPDPADPKTRRDIEDISPEELDFAIAQLRGAIAGLRDGNLVTHVARVFGFDRTGGRIRAVLEGRIAAMPPASGARLHHDGPADQ